MTRLSTTDFDKRVAAVNQARERAAERLRAKIADPEWQQIQKEKRVAASQRRMDRQKARRLAELAKPKEPKKKPPASRKSSRGMKGRTPTALERRTMDKIATIPCPCCAKFGRYNPIISLHHTDGRTKPMAHAKSLPLCQWHHDTPASKEDLAKYPDLIPIHAKGSFGGLSAWEAMFGPVDEMLLNVWHLAGVESEIFDLLDHPNQPCKDNPCTL